MLTFNVKKEWFEKIKSGEKTHEYREVKPHWTKRFLEYPLWNIKTSKYLPKYFCYCGNLYQLQDTCIFLCGYPRKDDKSKRLLAHIKKIDIIDGLDSDLKIDKLVFDIEFEVISE